MQLNTKRLILRDINDNDENALVDGVGLIEVARYLETVPFPYSIDDAKWFINKCKDDAKKQPREFFELAICLKEKPEILIGVIGLTKVNYFHEKGEIGYWLNQKYQRNGYMFEAVKELIRFVFDDLKLRRIDISAMKENVASNNLIKKLGFRYEGTKLKSSKARATEIVHDVNFYGMLKEDYKN